MGGGAEGANLKQTFYWEPSPLLDPMTWDHNLSQNQGSDTQLTEPYRCPKDPSIWYHFVYPQITNSEQCKLKCGQLYCLPCFLKILFVCVWNHQSPHVNSILGRVHPASVGWIRQWIMEYICCCCFFIFFIFCIQMWVKLWSAYSEACKRQVSFSVYLGLEWWL